MRLLMLSVAGSMLVASGIAAAAVEMIKPFEVLEETRRFNIEFDKRRKREKAAEQKQEKEREAQRKREEAEQRRRGQEEKAQQRAQAKRDAAAKGAHSPSTVPSQPPVAPALVKSAPMATPQAPTQAAEPHLQVHSPNGSQVSSEASAPPPPKPSTTGQVVEPRPQALPEPAASPAHAQAEPRERVQGGNPPATATTTGNAVAAPIPSGNAVAVSRLIKMDLHNERGDRIGDVEKVVHSADGKFHIVIGTGGFLGMRERNVRIPLDDGVTIRSDRLVIKGLTDDQVKAMPAFTSSDRRYRSLAPDATVRMNRDQSED